MNCQALGLSTFDTPTLVDVVIFRGTHSFGEMLQDMQSVTTTDFVLKKSKKSIGDVACGFYGAYTNFRDGTDLVDYVLKSAAEKNRRVIITGHSSGINKRTMLSFNHAYTIDMLLSSRRSSGPVLCD